MSTSPAANDTDVLIVGAGPTGLTLACELLRRGVCCRIIDRVTEVTGADEDHPGLGADHAAYEFHEILLRRLDELCRRSRSQLRKTNECRLRD